jgi:hypothetical protein
LFGGNLTVEGGSNTIGVIGNLSNFGALISVRNGGSLSVSGLLVNGLTIQNDTAGIGTIAGNVLNNGTAAIRLTTPSAGLVFTGSLANTGSAFVQFTNGGSLVTMGAFTNFGTITQLSGSSATLGAVGTGQLFNYGTIAVQGSGLLGLAGAKLNAVNTNSSIPANSSITFTAGVLRMDQGWRHADTAQ